jgi:hypothetical protein
MTRRLYVAGWHFLISCIALILTGVIVFGLWYPPMYAAIAGGWILFSLLVGINILLGPCLTLMVASSSKAYAVLRRDIGLIVLIQLGAFFYGIGSIAMARPVHLVFEVDRFRVVSAADVSATVLAQALPVYRQLPWTGPTVIAARLSFTEEEKMHSLELGLQGIDLGMQPDHWVGYASHIPAVLKAARPVQLLLTQYPSSNNSVHSVLDRHGLEVRQALFLPVVFRQVVWIAILNKSDACIVGYLPLEGFF